MTMIEELPEGWEGINIFFHERHQLTLAILIYQLELLHCNFSDSPDCAEKMTVKFFYKGEEVEIDTIRQPRDLPHIRIFLR